MSKQTVVSILKKALEDEVFHVELQYMPEDALKSFDLTEQERHAFKTRDFKALRLDDATKVLVRKVFELVHC